MRREDAVLGRHTRENAGAVLLDKPAQLVEFVDVLSLAADVCPCLVGQSNTNLSVGLDNVRLDGRVGPPPFDHDTAEYRSLDVVALDQWAARKTKDFQKDSDSS